MSNYWFFKQNPNRRINIIAFISQYVEKYHKAPTYREIMKGVGLKSTSGLWHHLVAMGFVGYKEKANAKDSVWRKNKEEFMSQWKCPLCKRDLCGEKKDKLDKHF